MIFLKIMFGGRLLRRARLTAMCFLVAALGGCSRTESPQRGADPQSAQATPAEKVVATSAPIDACSLLTPDEIAAVQGESPQEMKPSEQPARGLMMYDCLFALPTFTNSISLSVAQSGSGGQANPRDVWQETFATANAKASEKSPPPRPIEGIGEAAFWTGDDRIGALYVLKGARYLRISVGGAGDREEKINKCRTLAEAALTRM
jgi:hypothetical protein